MRGLCPRSPRTTTAARISDETGGYYIHDWPSAPGDEARKQIRGTFHMRRDHLLALLRGVGLRCVTPEGAFYTMVDIRDYGSSMEVAEAILAAGVVTVPGNAFGSEGEGFLRVSFCANLPVLAEGVSRMEAALAKLKQKPGI